MGIILVLNLTTRKNCNTVRVYLSSSSIGNQIAAPPGEASLGREDYFPWPRDDILNIILFTQYTLCILGIHPCRAGQYRDINLVV